MAAADEAWPAISESPDNVQKSAGYKTGSVSSESPIEKAGDKNNGKSGAKFRRFENAGTRERNGVNLKSYSLGYLGVVNAAFF